MAAAAFAAAPPACILETEGAATGVPAAVALAECAREALKALGMTAVAIDPAARTLFFGCGFGDDEGRPSECRALVKWATQRRPRDRARHGAVTGKFDAKWVDASAGTVRIGTPV